jgi:hypothetical protein
MYEFPPQAVRIALAACLYIFLMIAYRELYRTVKQTRPPGGGRARVPETRGGLGARPVPTLTVVAVGESSRSRVGEAFALLQTNTIGRAPENSIVVNDQWVSKRHARIHFDGVGFLVDDAGSTNGTLVNGLPAGGGTPLTPGARVQVGSTVLEYQE